MARTSPVSRKKARPIGKTAAGKPTLMPGSKDKVDVASEGSFPASDPPAVSANPPAAPPDQNISPARFLTPAELAKKSRGKW